MTRIAIISTRGTSNVGGVERVVSQQATILRDSYDVRVIALPEHNWAGGLRRRMPAFDRALTALFPSVSWLIARAWAGRKGMVFSHGYSSAGIGCDVVFAHGCWAAYTQATGIPRRRWGGVTRLYEWMAAHGARRLVAVSDAVAEQWVTHYGADRREIRVLPNAVDVSVFLPSRPDDSVCMGPDIRVMFVGRLEEAKGLDYLRRLHADITANAVPLSVFLFSPTQPTLEVTRQFPRFTIQCGLAAPELAAEYNRADLLLLPSQYEGCELCSLEALACGTPVLLNDTGARPTLERLACPAVYRLEEATSASDAIRSAVGRFRGLRRGDVAEWARIHFDERLAATRLQELCQELQCR